MNDLVDWMTKERARLSRHNEIAKAMDYMRKRIQAFTRFLGDGRICLSNNAAERELRAIALGRKSWLFAGSDRGGERAAVMLTLIRTAKLLRPGSPTCSPASPGTRSPISPGCCRGTGASLEWLAPPESIPNLTATHHPCGPERMVTYNRHDYWVRMKTAVASIFAGELRS